MGNPQAHCHLCKTKGMVNMEDIQKHLEDSPAVYKKENEAVDRITTVILVKMINPFQTHISIDLLNISTEEKASTLEQLTAKEEGVKILKDVQKSRRSKSVNYSHKDILGQKATNTSPIEKKYRDYIMMNLQLLRICFFFLQYLKEEKKVRALSFEWKKYPASLFELDDELLQGFKM